MKEKKKEKVCELCSFGKAERKLDDMKVCQDCYTMEAQPDY